MLLIDMGFGNAWLLRRLIQRDFPCRYIGIDILPYFVETARKEFDSYPFSSFYLANLEIPLDMRLEADVVVNAFNFFELSNLHQGMINAKNLLNNNGSLIISTIDKIFLIYAACQSWKEFKENLALYERLPGVKYFFQPIDLGDGSSEVLEYPSVLYSLDDYLSISKELDLILVDYKEHVFTSKAIPKIYIHLELLLKG